MKCRLQLVLNIWQSRCDPVVQQQPMRFSAMNPFCPALLHFAQLCVLWPNDRHDKQHAEAFDLLIPHILC